MPIRVITNLFPALQTILLLVVASIASAVQAFELPAAPTYSEDVLPILREKCGKCHNATVKKGELDLSSIQSLLDGGESGQGLISDSLAESHLWQVIDERYMPPDEEPPMSAEQVEIVRRWIEGEAASWQRQLAAQKTLNQHDILPIALLRCAACHGAREKRGELDMRTRDSMLVGGAHGPAIIPGAPEASLLIQRIESQACPPRDLLLKYFVKRPSQSEINTLRSWIAEGAIAGMPQEPEDLPKQYAALSEEYRTHWAFLPPARNAPGSSIDGFIVAKLRDNSLDLSPQAERDTLIRRVFYDLHGLPPDLSEWQRWRNNQASDWYAQMIDYLLASPRYGERWGRYWLDLAGYADSEGGVSADPVREVAWKYRDYVISAFNNDKPYDRFLIEQLAGDELEDYQHASVVTPQLVENLVATGFLRMGIDQTGSRTMNFVPERLGVIGDAITVVGEGLMGLTLGCARCHSHKYDPISHSDYYRFKAVFQGAFDEHDWLSFKNRNLELDTPERVARAQAINPPLEKELRQLEAELKLAASAVHITLLKHYYPDQSEGDRQATLKALKIADNNRTLPQRTLVERLQTVEVIPDSQQPSAVIAAYARVEEIERQIDGLKLRMEPSLTIRALWDRGSPSPTYLLRRGDHDNPGPPVEPGIPVVLVNLPTKFEIKPPFPDGSQSTGRRLALARWLTQPAHPLTARVMVNRVWHHHFGAGIVRSLENFGIQGERPSHPELLDWLAIEFVEHGWSIKWLHRQIMNSDTYKQSSQVTPQQLQRDPLNRWLSRMTIRRMDAESLRDSLLFLAKRLDLSPGGPPDNVQVTREGLVTVNPRQNGQWRRSVYAQFRRTEIPTLLETFDYPEMGPNCLSRSVSTVSLQSLMLTNNRDVRGLAEAFAQRVADETTEITSPQTVVNRVYQLALSRYPTPDELDASIDALQQLKIDWKGDIRGALATYCHTILNSAAFLYVD